MYSGSLLVLYVAIGGFTISTRFKKFNIYKNGFVVTYPLNPALKSNILKFDSIVSATLSYDDEEETQNVLQPSGYLIISYTDGIKIRSKEFSLSGISADHMEKVAAFLKRRKVMIKIFGDQWDHKSINEIELQLPEKF